MAQTKQESSAKVLKTLLDTGAAASCINCIHFINHKSFCEKYNANPPAETIVFSCKISWKQDIPF